MSKEFKEVMLSDIVLSGDNARKVNEKDQDFLELKESIKAGGVRVPIQVRKHPEKKGKFELRYGERRYRACRSLDLKTIPAIISSGLSDAEALDLTYMENKFRKSLKPMEEAAEVVLMLERFGSAKAVAETIGKDAQWVHVRANISSGLIKKWKEVMSSPDKHPEFKNWTLSHLSQIARLPKKMQEVLLAEMGHWRSHPEKISAVDLGDMIAKALHLLSKSKWELDDQTLLPKAGPCSKCPKRSGHQPILWFDSDEQVDAGDQCLDSLCWKAKEIAWLERRAAELRAKHPNLVLVMSEPTRGCDTNAITEKMGAPMGSWQYKTCSKSTKGAVPAMYVNNKGAGKVAYIKVITAMGRAGKSKGVPTPLKVRRAVLDAKRWAQVLIDLKEKVDKTDVNGVQSCDIITAVMAMVAFQGNSSIGHEIWGSIDKELARLVADKENGQVRALEYLWKSFKPTLKQSLTYNGPITHTPKQYIKDAGRIAAVIGADIKAMFKEVSKRKGFTEPKSWAGLKTDGTPKKEKPNKKADKKKAAAKKDEPEKRICRICGCTDYNACLDKETGVACHWVEDDLCSNCEHMAVKKTA